ncbi:MAG: hypothetical protein AAF961_07665 [Planctomycetota bacterium]
MPRPWPVIDAESGSSEVRLRLGSASTECPSGSREREMELLSGKIVGVRAGDEADESVDWGHIRGRLTHCPVGPVHGATSWNNDHNLGSLIAYRTERIEQR